MITLKIKYSTESSNLDIIQEYRKQYSENRFSDDYPEEIKEIGNYLQSILEKIKDLN